MSYIEIKNHKRAISKAIAQKIVDKGNVSGFLTTGQISAGAKELFNEAGIAWAENIPEKEFMESEAKELE
jgi:hypothetical protein